MTEIHAKFQFSYASAFVMIYHANKGEGLPMHVHRYSHAVMCNAGKCAVRTLNKNIEMTSNTQPINLKELEHHEIEALEDGTVFVTIFEAGKG